MIEAGESLNDNSWHSLRLWRQQRSVKVDLDSRTVVNMELPSRQSPERMSLVAITVDEVTLGQPIGESCGRATIEPDFIAKF